MVATAAIMIIPVIMRRKGPHQHTLRGRGNLFESRKLHLPPTPHAKSWMYMTSSIFIATPPAPLAAVADCAGLRPSLYSGGATRRDARLIFVSSSRYSDDGWWFLLLVAVTLEKPFAIINSSPQILLCRIGQCLLNRVVYRALWWRQNGRKICSHQHLSIIP